MSAGSKGGMNVQGVFRAIREYVKKADMVLLLLCITATIFGMVIISSATNYLGSGRYLLIQGGALLLGIALYVVLTLVDVDIIAERWELLLIFSVLFIGLLRFFGVEGTTGNKSWLSFKFLPFNIQPGEICKVLYIIILAKIMSVKQNKLSSPLTVLQLGAITLLLAGLIVVVSYDDGVALNYLIIFLIMAFVGGVGIVWFLAGFGALAALTPLIWTKFLDTYQRERILVLFDPTVDPNAREVRWQMNRSLRMLQNGGVAGQGLYRGSMVQAGLLPAQHTDFIFSSTGEELGMIGCLILLLLLAAIIIRCVYVGIKSGNYMNRLICVGIAGMIFTQTAVNVGMCLGVFPVVGLTLPFISYGGSSIVTVFAAMGIVSGIRMRPAPDAGARYIRPKH